MSSTRRNFLKKTAVASIGAGMFPTIVKASALGREGHVAPSDRINLILIGCGGMGKANMSQFLTFKDVRATAVCDVDKNQAASAKKMFDDAYGKNNCRVYKDFREILVKEKADAAVIALPDHWHAIISCATADKKINIYGEKPLARYLDESKAIVNAVKRNKIVWQTGSQQRSVPAFHHAAELVINGRIGKVNYVEVGLPDGGHNIGSPAEMPVPEGVDWDMWLGPAPKVPFRGVLHGDWRWILDYSGGQLTDWAGHHIDIAHWGLGLDRTGPVSVEGSGRSNEDGIYNVPVEYDFMCEYANGLKLRVANQSKLKHGMGAFWQGSEGWIHVNRGGLYASDSKILEEVIGDDEIKLYKSENHQRNFIDCIKSGKETIAPAEIAHRSISVAHLGEIAMMTRQKLSWDPVNEIFADNNYHASRLLSRAYRGPWQFPG